MRIISPADSAFAGADGTVLDVKINSRNLTILDSYTIELKWGEKQTFWDAQLETFSDPPPKAI